MNKILMHTFTNQKLGNIRCWSDINGKIMFLAYDVAHCLGKTKSFNMTERLDRREMSKIFIKLDRYRWMNSLTEEGLYHALNISTSPNAELLSNWLKEDVIPYVKCDQILDSIVIQQKKTIEALNDIKTYFLKRVLSQQSNL